MTDNPSIRIHKAANRMTFWNKEKYCQDVLTPETMKLFASTKKSKVTKDENGESVPHSEMTKVVSVHCNVVSNDYQHSTRVLHKLVTNKSFGQLLFTKKKLFLQTVNSEFSYIEIWFTDQSSKH